MSEKARVSDLPVFKYHPSPLQTGSIVDSEATCECCGQARGFIYEGPIYCEAVVDKVCPWCIADGSAHTRWDAEFTDVSGIGGGKWCEVPEAVREEVAYRTPGFSTCQDARWMTHCGDAAEFLGVDEEDGGTRVRFRCRVCHKRGSYRDID